MRIIILNLDLGEGGKFLYPKIPQEISLSVTSKRECKEAFCPLSHVLIGSGELCVGGMHDGSKGVCYVSVIPEKKIRLNYEITCELFS